MLLYQQRRAAPSDLLGTTWANLSIVRLSVILFYGLITSALWAAPLYGWLLLVGAYARRATFFVGRPTLGSRLPRSRKIVVAAGYIAQIVGQRVTGRWEEVFVVVQYPKGTHAPTRAARSGEISRAVGWIDSSSPPDSSMAPFTTADRSVYARLATSPKNI